MNLIQAFLSYGLKYILYMAVAVAGVLCGKKLRDAKTKKKEQAKTQEQ